MGVIKQNSIAGLIFVVIAFAMLPACNILYPTTQEPYTNPDPGTFIVHRVKQSESIAVISKLYGVSTEEIQRINRKDLNKVVEGDFIRVPQTAEQINKVKKDTSDVREPKAITELPIGNEIDIALLLPFYLDRNFGDDQYDVHSSTVPALQFYEGAQLAVNDLLKDSIKVNIKAYDSSQKNNVRNLLASPNVLNNDVLIGEFSNSILTDALPVVKSNNKNLVLLKAFRSKLLSYHPQVALAKPSSASQCKLMAKYIQNQFSSSDFYLLFQDIRREKDLAAMFKEELDSVKMFAHYEMSEGDMLMKDSDDEIKKLFDMMDSSKMNVIFITSSDQPFVNSVLRRLYTKASWNITIVGLPTWENFNSIDSDILNHFNLHIFSTEYIDYSDPFINQWRKKFIAEFNTDPVYNAYEGYFLVRYLSDLYSRYGDNYHDFLKERPDKHYSFKQIGENGGYENSRFSILAYRNFKLIKVN